MPKPRSSPEAYSLTVTSGEAFRSANARNSHNVRSIRLFDPSGTRPLITLGKYVFRAVPPFWGNFGRVPYVSRAAVIAL